MHPHSWRYALPFVVLVVLLAACGGDGAPSGTPTPTLLPTTTPPPTRTPMPAAVGFLPIPTGQRIVDPIFSITPQVTPARNIFFSHPEGELRWDGPDDRVRSLLNAHCRIAGSEFGVPALILVEDGLGFWGALLIPREEGWGWTGYSHGEWYLWQGDDALKVYLVHAQEPGVAFEYRFFLCA